jgi:histidinol-phosphate/aromatic aminotransferase/cobyric acid decarboxylase-like protein
MKRFLGYYRQFEELSPEEVSRELKQRRDEEKAQALTETPPLDLSSPAWHEPPHAEIVNAATFALRRAVNGYPDAGTAIEALAARHGVESARVVAGHGAGELLRAALHALLGGGGAAGGGAASRAGGEVAIAWPGWGLLPRLVHEAGGRPVPVPLGRDGAPDVDALAAAAGRAGDGFRAVALCSPNDPTGGTIDADALRRLAGALPSGTWILLDAALADFEEPGADLAGLTGELERLLVFRSFSKAHAMAGFRAGYAVGPEGAEELLGRLAPALGVSAPAAAGITWAAGNGERYLPRRRELAAAEREHLAAVLAGTDFAFPAGTGPLLWLSSASLPGKDVAAALATKRIFVAPGAAWGDDRHVRIALRGPEATARLAAALNDLAGNVKGAG